MVQDRLACYRLYGEDGIGKSTKGYHFTSGEKEKIILEHIKYGVTLQQLSLRYDVSRSTIKSWLRKVRSGGSLYDKNNEVDLLKTQWQDRRRENRKQNLRGSRQRMRC